MRYRAFFCDRCQAAARSEKSPENWGRMNLRGRKVGWDLCPECVDALLEDSLVCVLEVEVLGEALSLADRNPQLPSTTREAKIDEGGRNISQIKQGKTWKHVV